MELRQLRQFVTLSQTLNFRRAAEILHIAQPPLSVSIAKLERELGVQLFERHQRGVRLTAAGEAALPIAGEITSRAEEIREAVGAVASGRRGQLRLGFVSSATYSILPRLISAFRSAYPNIELVLEELRGVEVLSRVENASLDLGIVRTPLIGPTETVLSALESSHLAVALPNGHPLQNVAELELATLADESFVMYDQSLPSMRALIFLVCQNAGFLPKFTHSVTQIHSLFALVEMGLGLALVPDNVQAAFRGAAQIVPMTCRGEKIEVGLSLVRRPREASKLITRFHDAAMKLAANPAA